MSLIYAFIVGSLFIGAVVASLVLLNNAMEWAVNGAGNKPLAILTYIAIFVFFATLFGLGLIGP